VVTQKETGRRGHSLECNLAGCIQQHDGKIVFRSSFVIYTGEECVLGRHISCRSLKSQKVPRPQPKPLSCRWMSGIRIHGALAAPSSSSSHSGSSLLRVFAQQIPIPATRPHLPVVIMTMFFELETSFMRLFHPSSSASLAGSLWEARQYQSAHFQTDRSYLDRLPPPMPYLGVRFSAGFRI
jgi:hypothetical protein